MSGSVRYAIAQAKGGVGKTSLATNLAGTWARKGRRVLLLDFDPQGNCALDLGFEPDTGKALLNALITAGEPPVLRDVRKGLDVIPSGPLLDRFVGAMMGEANIIEAMAGQVDAVINLAGQYDVVIIDTAPGDSISGQAAMATATHIVAPARADDASLLGTIQLAGRFADVRTLNPDLTFAGVVLFGIGSRMVRIEREIRDQLEATLDGAVPVLRTVIRDAPGAAVFGRRHGLLAAEIATAAADGRAAWLAASRTDRPKVATIPSTNAAALAADYEAVAVELAATTEKS